MYSSLGVTSIMRMPEIIKYKKLDLNVPDLMRHTDGSAGFDLCNAVTLDNNSFSAKRCHKIPTGISIEIPNGYYGLLLPRSSYAYNNQFILLEIETSIIDSDYRGEIHIPITFILHANQIIPQYTRLVQLIIQPCFMGEMRLSDELSETQRGDKGFGST